MAVKKIKKSELKIKAEPRKSKHTEQSKAISTIGDQHETLVQPISKGIPKLAKAIILGVIIVGIILYFFRSWFVAAIVNGQPISRISVIQELEKQGGSQTLSSIVTRMLITQAMQKKGITVSQKELDDQLKVVTDSIKKQGSTLDQALAMQGETKDSFMERLKIQIMAQKLFAKDIQVTDKEVDDVMSSPNKKTSLQIDTTLSDAQQRVAIRQRLQQQKLGQKFQSWLADLQKNAKIIKFVNY